MATATEWAARVEAWRASGKVAREYCVGRDYAPKQLLQWSSRLKRDVRQVLPPQKPTMPLARVVREQVSAPRPRVAVAVTPVIVQVGVAQLEIPAGTDRGTLATIFEILLSSGRGALR